MTTSTHISELKGVGEALAKKYALLGIKSIGDLINYYPRRYEDYSEVTAINKLRPGPVSIKVVIKSANGRYSRRGLYVTEAIASDETGSVRLVWFNQPYRQKSIKTDQTYYLSGNYELSRSRFSIINPAIELTSDFPANTARILPIYRETKGLTSAQIRLAIRQVHKLIEDLPETLPEWLIKKEGLLSRAEAFRRLHFPNTGHEIKLAEKRLGFEEVFSLSLASLLNKQEIKSEKAFVVPFKQELAINFVKHLPFNLTNDQRLIIWQIYKDLMKDQPMNRLVEGDVGAGKTVVATMSALMALADFKQVALMAPTELLARQHANTIHSLLKPLGYESQVALLVGSMSKAQKDKAHKSIKDGQAGFIIGTQALLQDEVDIHNLGLVIIDEQHRFGVTQRQSLMSKAGHMPHVLSLTATPIPRSLALTLYGELDISQLKDKPAGRQPVKTELIWPGDRQRLYKQIDKSIEEGRQIFVVCPSISLSAAIDAKAAEAVYNNLSKGSFKHRRVGLLHGKLNSKSKQEVMAQLINKQLDILVATTVIEVGVDIPNVTIMLIENPERYGLAQLHQLRGRIGRGDHQGQCYLMLSSTDAPLNRLRALVNSSDGFSLAELDLELRGPGAIYGTLQHGALDLRIAKLNDLNLINAAVNAAKEFINKRESLLEYKYLNKNINNLRSVTNLN